MSNVACTTMSRRWSVEKRKRSQGPYYVLRSRSVETGSAVLSLGYIDREAAQRAKETMNEEEGAGTARRILHLFDQDTESAVAYLVGDPADKHMFSIEPAYGIWSIQRYFTEVFAPWRATEVRGWPQEQSRWRQILPDLGHVRIRDVDEWVVADYLDGLKASTGRRAGKPLSGNAKRLRKACIQAMLHYAYRQKHIDKLPHLAVFRVKGSTRVVQMESDPLSLDEVLLLLESANSCQQRAMWGVCAGEGLRPTELIRLRWEGVDWEDRTLAIPGHEDGPVVGLGKTAMAATTIPMTPFAYQELRDWWQHTGQPREGWMFVSPKTGKPYVSYNSLHRPLTKAAKRAGIKRAVYPRLLRKSFATIAWSLGIPVDTTRRIMRHVDEKMLANVYQRVRPADMVRLVKAFDIER